MASYERSCRLCLKELKGPGYNCASITELRDAIFRLFEIQIRRKDTTKSICCQCFETVMAFTAFKKTVFGCQKLIKEYEAIKKRILENRELVNIKQEVIDLSEVNADISSTKNISNVPNSLTNHILDKAKSQPSIEKSLAKDTSIIPSKRLKTTPAIFQSLPIREVIKQEPCPSSSSTSPIACVQGNVVSLLSPSKENGTPAVTARSSNLRTTTSKSNTISNSTATSGTEKAINAHEILIKKEPQPAIENGTSCKSGTDTDNLVSQMEVTTEQTKLTPQNYKTSSIQKLRDKTKSLENTPNGISNLSEVNSSNSRLSFNETNASNSSVPKVTSIDVYECPKCSVYLKTREGAYAHISRRHNIPKLEAEKIILVTKKKHIHEKGDNPASNNNAIKSETNSVRERSCRQAKSQAMKKLVASPPKRRLSFSPNQKKSLCPLSVQDDEVIPNFTKLVKDNNTSTPVLKNSDDKKRGAITVILLRTKDGVTFKYLDDFKQNIDFSSVTKEVLVDIRNSLMKPDIWSTLTKVFQATPPDDKTIKELKVIFGGEFKI